jgi:hypothetical protein
MWQQIKEWGSLLGHMYVAARHMTVAARHMYIAATGGQRGRLSPSPGALLLKTTRLPQVLRARLHYF